MRQFSKEQMAIFEKVWSKIIAKAWSDPVFKQRLIEEPRKVFKENGLEIPSDIELRISDSDKIVYLNLPEPPGEYLDDEFLKKVGGADYSFSNSGGDGMASSR